MNHLICICNVGTNVTFVLLHRHTPCLSSLRLFIFTPYFFGVQVFRVMFPLCVKFKVSFLSLPFRLIYCIRGMLYIV